MTTRRQADARAQRRRKSAGDSRAPTFTPLDARLRPPRAYVELVPRQALADRLLAISAPLVLVSAPAGYGKSTLLSQWGEADPRPLAWLQLDAADDDPVVLLTMLAMALEPLAPVDPDVFTWLRTRSAAENARIVAGLEAAVAAARPFLLVLDDGHLVQAHRSWEIIAALLGQLPDGAQLAIGTRGEPPLPLARLRVSGRLAEVRTHDLELTRDEARQLLTLQEVDTDDRGLDALMGLTEGWATGLYLAALAGRESLAGDWVAAVRGDRREIAQYLVAEVLERQPEDVQRLLTRTSILTRLSPDLCAAVAGDDGARLFERVARENLFVIALDDRGDWFRYHHLFRTLLEQQLERREPSGLIALHRRAAEWLLAHGHVEEAVGHALAAGDPQSVTELAVVTADQYVQTGQMERARALFARFPDEHVARSPSLMLFAAMLAGFVPDAHVQRWARAACAATFDEDGPAPLGAASLRSFQLLMRANLGFEGVQRMCADAALACELERVGDTGAGWYEYTLQVCAFAHYLCGAPKTAQRFLKDALELSTDPELEAWYLAMLALIAGDQGRWDDAEDLAREMEARAVTDIVLRVPIALVRARMLARRGAPDVGAYLEEAERDLRAHFATATWRVLLPAIVFAEISLETGDIAGAERRTAEAEMLLRHYPDAGIMRPRTEWLRGALEQRRLTEPLTPAERRVLELLPTQLTAAQIAARLFITTNTVKTHTRRLYAKLGATKRTEAVELARRLGLLGHADQS